MCILCQRILRIPSLTLNSTLFFAARSRIGVANMARQRVLTVASPSTIVCSSVSETSSIISPMNTSQGVLSHSTPLRSAAPPMRMAITPAAHQQTQDVRLNVPSEYQTAYSWWKRASSFCINKYSHHPHCFLCGPVYLDNKQCIQFGFL